MIEFADPKEWWLELTPTIQAEAMRQSQRCSLPQSQQAVYLNGLCLQSVLSWLADGPESSSWLPPSELPALWEVVNGTGVRVGTTRLVLIPTEAIDDSELAVPQEWVDIPSWAGDYYLAVQVQSERNWVRIWGYTTHQELKFRGEYDPSDRTYSLAADQLTQDLNAFWVTMQLCETNQTQAGLAPLPELSPGHAESLIQRLSDLALMFPRLAVPFTLWGALLEQPEWRHQLFQQRTGVQSAVGAVGAVVRLREWWLGNFTAAWQDIAAVISPRQLAPAWRSEADSQPTFTVSRAKVLEFGDQPGEEAIALVIGLVEVSESRTEIGLQICPTGENRLLPSPVQVRLLDAVGNEVGQASAAITETIQLQFEAEFGEKFQIEVISGAKRMIEEFEV